MPREFISHKGAHATSILWRILVGFGFGALMAFILSPWGLGILFFAGLCAGAIVFSRGIGLARLLVALAIWFGQYAVFWLRDIAPYQPSVEAMRAVALVNNLRIFMPAVAIVVGTYLGLVMDRLRRTLSRR